MYAMYFVAISSLAALVFATCMFVGIKRQPGGSPEMQRIPGSVQKGANAYLKRQYKGVGIFFAVVFAILVVMAFCGFLSFFTPFAFLTGGFFSDLSGFIGMRTATMVSCHTAQEASESLNKGLRVTFSAGSVMGFTVVGLGLFDLTVWYFTLNTAFSSLPEGERIAQIIANMLTFGMGVSSMALFARAGGGIFTEAADVGADLVEKVEAGIPEDDPRNPTVIADSVGDNVGDVAGMGADLYESYVGPIVSTSALVVAAGYGARGVAMPMMLAALGVVASIIGTFFVNTKEDASQKNPLQALRTGTYISALLVVAAAFFTIRVLLPGRMGIYAAVLSGLLVGVAIGVITEYYTSDSYSLTRKLAGSSETGGTTMIISGLSLGMTSTVAPVIIVGASMLVSYCCAGGQGDFNAGLYGVGVSAVGMLSILGITLATDAYGPVADNVRGIAETTHIPPEIGHKADALDSLGSTMAATGKGFAIGSAALTALALIAFYIDKVRQIAPNLSLDLSITNSTVLIGLFTGGTLPFLFAALTMDAVGEAVQSIVVEVRRQFKKIAGLMKGKVEPDYSACVDMCTKSVQRLMIALAMVVVAVPVAVGLLLGPQGVAGLLAGNTVTDFVLAVMMSNAGGTRGNAKKYIEGGARGGEGSPEHKAAVIGDTVDGPFKDTSGPSINILIKLTSMVSIVSAGLVVAVHLL